MTIFLHFSCSTQSGTKYDLHEDLAGKTYIVTGATSGIGQATAEELAKRNARVIMACRNREKCVQVRRDIVLNTRNKQVYCRQCDLEDFDSIRTFVQKLSKGKFELDRIDGIVHNAAMMQSERHVNKDGIEKTIATNHLGSFLLTGLLLDKLLNQTNPVRIVFLNSNIIDRKCDLNLGDFNSEGAKKFDGYEVYKHSKLASALFSKELSERLKESNCNVIVADPGRTKSNLSAQMDGQTFFLSRWLLKIVSFGMGERRTEKAVRPVLYALCDPETVDENGLFIE
ncbi:CRE-DHS-24 protein [Caenorhabditis remanei]|uniref:CRE-DHS-24 protein n=1 Tax=Caenorhabditis remanei TaxID=31234 RepID=E3NLL2_CAERE|nr:CRE-DHS-24 protein [Caenorhabditis remanei]